MFKRFLLFVFIFTAITTAQEKVVHFKKLQEFLPRLEVRQFTREKPTGVVQTITGYSVSIASVIYNEQVPEDDSETLPRSVTINITDAMLYQAGLVQYLTMTDYESESDDGYDKSYKVNGTYPGLLSVHNQENKAITLAFAVGQRFLVQVDADNTDNLDFILSFVNNMDLEGLATLR